MERTTLIVLAARLGDPISASLAEVPRCDEVIAVDSGLHLAVTLGLQVDVVIGDLDSVDPALVTSASDTGSEVLLHPRDKDHTDLALALAKAHEDGATDIVVIGGAGGRLDHGLANLVALADPALAGTRVRATLGGAEIHVVRSQATTVTGPAGSLLSLVAVGGPATVSTQGLRWDLHDETLSPTSTRGVSNEFVATTAVIQASVGVVLCIQPAPDEALER